jgi:hypothetical protein
MVMINHICLLLTGLIVWGCAQTSTSNDNYKQQVFQTHQQPKPLPLSEIFTLKDAETIMGESLHISDSATTIEKEAEVYRSGYEANSEDLRSGKIGAIYFLFERFNQVAAAKQKYKSTFKANEDHGAQPLKDVGDEAYFHSDNENFYFIMIRKGRNVFCLKVNKITSTTSLDEFNKVARRIAAGI